MPIIGLTDQIEAGMPRIGKLRKGAKKPSENEIGKDLTYFRFVCEDPMVVAAFEAAYGKEPRVINAFLPFETVEDNFPTWMEERGKHSLKHRCNGKVMVLWQDSQGIYRTTPEPCPYAEYPDGDKRRKCTEKGTLHIIIPELLSVRWGYIEVRTGSKWDCLELSRNLAEVKSRALQVSLMKGQAVTMQHIPCILRRAPRMTSCPVKGNRIMQEKWLLTLEIEPNYFQSVLKASRMFALPLSAPQLEAPVLELDYDPGENGEGVEYPETEILDSEPTEEVQAQTNGRAERPLEPEQLRKFLHHRAGNDLAPATKKQVPFVASKFTEAFAPDDDATQEYHSALLWLWEVDSAKSLTKAQAKATLDWLLDPDGPDDSGDTPLHQHAPEEARRVLRVALQEAGQQELPLEA